MNGTKLNLEDSLISLDCILPVPSSLGGNFLDLIILQIMVGILFMVYLFTSVRRGEKCTINKKYLFHVGYFPTIGLSI